MGVDMGLVMGMIGVVMMMVMGVECGAENGLNASLHVNAADPGYPIPDTLFGIFFEEINHAGAGGLWAELVSNRGFEAGGPNTPSDIAPWSIVGDESQVLLQTERSSCFERNPLALRVDILCDECPDGGVGVYNPGFWGMDINVGNEYRVVFWINSDNSVNLSVAFTSSNGDSVLAQTYVSIDDYECGDWIKQEIILIASATDHEARLSLTSMSKGTFRIDQVSAMPLDTYKGHGFRKDLALMVEALKPRFVRFPGGCYVEGQWLRNAFRWRQSIGPWEERPGHFGDVWGYWTDDGLGYFEFLQLAEDLNASPIWVFNNGISHTDQVASSTIDAFVTDILHGIEFARGSPDSTWGSVRAEMGHPEPFDLKYIAIGNEDCGKQYYRANYLKFYEAIKESYPDIGLISNCDGSSRPLNHPADLYDFHIYTSASSLFAMTHQFDHTSRSGPKAFVSEYAVTGHDAGKGSLLAALAEGAFLIGIEKNSDVVHMASYAPLFVNTHDRRWNPDAIVFNSWQAYGTPSYWVQQFFKDSSGASLLPIVVSGDDVSRVLSVSAVRRCDDENGLDYIVIKAVNFGKQLLRLQVSIDGIVDVIGSESTLSILTSNSVMDENSFDKPDKVVLKKYSLAIAQENMAINLLPESFISLDLPIIKDMHPSM